MLGELKDEISQNLTSRTSTACFEDTSNILLLKLMHIRYDDFPVFDSSDRTTVENSS